MNILTFLIPVIALNLAHVTHNAPTAQSNKPGGRLANRSSELSLASLEHADPRADLRRNIARRELRFVGLYGYATYYPGINNGNGNLVVEYKGARMVKGTSDGIGSETQGRLQAIARRYAEVYNRALMSHLKAAKDPDFMRARKKGMRDIADLYGRDAAADSRAANKHADNRLICVRYDSNQLPGLSRYETAGLHGSLRVLDISKDVVKPKTWQRFTVLSREYIAPYNRAIFLKINRSARRTN